MSGEIRSVARLGGGWAFQPEVRDSEVWNVNGEDEHQWWPRTLWIDPGGVSGYCVLWFHPCRFLDRSTPLIRSIIAWEAGWIHGPENDQVAAMEQMIRELGGPCGLTVGAESFVVRQLNMKKEFLSPVRIDAALRHQLWKGTYDYDGELRRRPLFSQTPADAKTTVTDDRLRLWAMFTPGADHARDATRHAILHLRKMRAQDGAQFRRAWGWESGWNS